MKTGESKKSSKKQAKKRSKAAEWFINIFTIALFGSGFAFIAYTATQTGHTHSEDPYFASLPAQGDTIAHNKVCMVDDIYQGDYPTLLIPVSNKKYYGCEDKTTQDLRIKPELRIAIDPYTKGTVDKATAVIGLDPKRDGKVLYFESIESHQAYTKLHSH